MSIRNKAMAGITAVLAATSLALVTTPASADTPTTDGLVPTISVNLTDGAYVSGTQTITVTAEDDALTAVHAQLYSGSTQVPSVKGYTNKDNQLVIQANWAALADGAYTFHANANGADGKAPTLKINVIKDTTKPTATLASPTGAYVNNDDELVVNSTDNRGLNKVVANVYLGDKLIKSTQAAAGGALDKTHAVKFGSLGLPDGTYKVKYNASDLAGNIASTGVFEFTLDNVAPTVEVKPTSKGGLNPAGSYLGVFTEADLKLKDNRAVGGTVLNGVVKNVTANAYSDYNDIKPGKGGAVEGSNTIQVFDLAGNVTTYTVKFDVSGPIITIKSSTPNGNGVKIISFKASDPSKVVKFDLNGVVKNVVPNQWTDLDFVTPGKYGAVEGDNILTAYDALGNVSSVFLFTLDTTVVEPEPQPEIPTDTPSEETPSQEAMPPFPMTAPAL